MGFSWISSHRGSIIMVAISAILFATSVSVAFSDPAPQGVAGFVQVPADQPIRIMPLGDSITAGESVPCSYRIELAKLLEADRRMFAFVGTQSNGPPDLKYRWHEGHSGWCLAECGNNNLHDHLYQWLTVTQPDVVLLDAGTNDLLQKASKPEAVDRLRLVVGDIYRVLPDTHLYIAQIRDGGAFNDGVVDVAAQARAGGHFAVVVNMDDSGGFDDDDYVDGIHPSAGGADKMASKWYEAMRANSF
jgi:GDSL-like Lipase/Acylhydrolase family